MRRYSSFQNISILLCFCTANEHKFICWQRHHNYNKKANLKAYSTSYTTEECKRLLLESRATVIDSRMTDIDRSDKNIILNDGRVVPYDTLILAMGIQDNTLNCDKGV